VCLKHQKIRREIPAGAIRHEVCRMAAVFVLFCQMAQPAESGCAIFAVIVQKQDS
jgi:hypothetical protein